MEYDEIHSYADTHFFPISFDFMCETDTYNRDDIPCIDFTIPKELSEKAGQLIEKVKEMQKSLTD